MEKNIEVTLYKTAQVSDWEALELFYHKIYRKNHPLQNFDFWKWQYGSKEFGQAFIAMHNAEVVGHVGSNFGGGYAWMMNAFLDERFRGQGVMRKLYDMAREHAPLATTSANPAGLGMYRNMQWYRYCDLQRYVAVNPAIETKALIQKISVRPGYQKPSKLHYWMQPGIDGIQLPDGSTGVLQEHIGAIRLVEIVDPAAALKAAWETGIHWVDFVTSWNDPMCTKLEKAGWLKDRDSPIPWRLDPLIDGSRCEVSFLSEEPLPRNLIVKRYFCDHGRVGSIIAPN